ncbi:MAG TPA: hypothetical protein VN708_15050 [Terriglobales bacterium]|jgi:hypothetical protein|nr:hypothetical protein [Terriglobales bacterium]
MPVQFAVLLILMMTIVPRSLLAQSAKSEGGVASWKLPNGLEVKDSGPRTYRFVVDYNNANSRGEIFLRQRLVGEYTRGLPGGEVAWKNVTEATAQGETAAYGEPQKREFMEGFRYHNDIGSTFAPDFFKVFPPMAFMERNLVWDTGMIEMFGQNYFAQLKLNEPYHAIRNEDAKIPGAGKFTNRDVVLKWIGQSWRNGQECAVIQYQAFFNPIDLSVTGMKMKGRSDYWGEIWVSLTSKQVEFGTLYESVVADMQLPGQATPQLVNIFRIGTLEPLTGK